MSIELVVGELGVALIGMLAGSALIKMLWMLLDFVTGVI